MALHRDCLRIKGEHDGEILYVSKYDYQGIVLNRKLQILSIRAVGGKVVIDYVTKRNLVRGCKEFKDLGPQSNKVIKGK